MKGMEEFGDLIAMGIGMFGAFLKGLKKKLKAPTIILNFIRTKKNCLVLYGSELIILPQIKTIIVNDLYKK
jgi:hypothetical protein